jgi:putative endonuclease
MRKYWVYITTNRYRTVRYIGVTNNLRRRLGEHVENQASEETFTGKYKAHNLLYFEEYTDIQLAIAREKQLKNWTRAKKDALIRMQNPSMDFLEFDI